MISTLLLIPNHPFEEGACHERHQNLEVVVLGQQLVHELLLQGDVVVVD